MKRYFLSIFLLLPVLAYGAECTVLAKVQNIQIRDCGQRELEMLGASNEALSRERYEEIPVGLEQFWSRFCNCTMWQVTGITAGHTRVVRVYKEAGKSGLAAVPGGEFSSGIGLVSRFETSNGLFMETQDADAGGKHPSRTLYRFDGSKFVTLRRASIDERNR